jgi:hypothetical protein
LQTALNQKSKTMAGGKRYLILLALIGAISLHYVSNMSSHNGLGSGNIVTLPGSELKSQRIGELMQQRSKLNEEIALLQHVVQQLKQVFFSP